MWMPSVAPGGPCAEAIVSALACGRPVVRELAEAGLAGAADAARCSAGIIAHWIRVVKGEP